MNQNPEPAKSSPASRCAPAILVAVLGGASFLARLETSAWAQSSAPPPQTEDTKATDAKPTEDKKPADEKKPGEQANPPLPDKPGMTDPNAPLPAPGTVPDPLPVPELPPGLPLYHPTNLLRPAPGQAGLAPRPMFEPFEVPDPAAARPTNYFVPGYYGRAGRVFTTGRGLLALPTWSGSLTLGMGYDSNINETSGATGGEPESGAFASLRASVAYQKAKPLRLTILSGQFGTEYSSANSNPEFNFDIGLSHLRTLVSPGQISANVRFAYLTQTDYSQVNVTRPVDEENGDGGAGYFVFDAKVDYSHRWTTQLSTRTSLAGNINYHGDSGSSSGTGGENLATLTLGNEFRYRSGRYTWVFETRGEYVNYFDGGQENSNSVYLLLGADWQLSSYIQLLLRTGTQQRFFDESDNSSSPYGEFSVNFQPNVQNSFSLNMRYGFEAGNLAGDDQSIFRIGGSYSRAITSRLSASLAANYLLPTGGSSETASLGGGGSNDGPTLDGSLSLNYRLSDQIYFGATFSATKAESDGGEESNYDRTRAFFVVGYTF